MQQTISSNEFVPVILGGDITAYSLALSLIHISEPTRPY